MALKSGTIELAGQTTAKQVLVSGGKTRSVGLLALKTNAETMYVGGKTECGEEKKAFPLEAGQFVSIDITDAGLVYAAGKAGDKVGYLVDTLLQ